ncbi:POP5 family protein [Megaselia abdita]
MKNVGKYYGEFGIGSTEYGFRVKYCNDKTRIAVIRVRHRPHRFVTSILPLICVIGDHKAKFRTLYTGATIMQCNKFIVKHQRDVLDKTIGTIDSAKERSDFLKNIMEFSVD